MYIKKDRWALLRIVHDMGQFAEQNDIIFSNEASRVDERGAVDSRSRFRLRIPPTVADSISVRSDTLT